MTKLAVAVAALAAAASIHSAAAVLGVDVSSPVSAADAKCMVDNGRTFGIVRAWCSYGGFDSNAPGTVAAMWAGGMAHVDVYLFPCVSQDPTSQVNSLVSDLAAHGVKYGQIWLDIESNPSPGCGWGVTNATGQLSEEQAANNCAYVAELAAAIKAHGIVPGVYASEYEWSITVGSGCNSVAGYPLWYAHYDGNPSFSDFTPFGGWTKPAMKQYSGTGSLCGIGIDSNYYP